MKMIVWKSPRFLAPILRRLFLGRTTKKKS